MMVVLLMCSSGAFSGSRSFVDDGSMCIVVELIIG